MLRGLFAVEVMRGLEHQQPGRGQHARVDETGSTSWADLRGPPGAQRELTNTILTAARVRDLVERMLKSSGRRVDLSTPFVDAMLPDVSRLHVVIRDIADGVRNDARSEGRTPSDPAFCAQTSLHLARVHQRETARGRPRRPRPRMTAGRPAR
jgi:hypothetical protein